MSASKNPPGEPLFPTFASLAEAEAYSDKTGDAYYEICYHLEGNLNLCIAAMHDLYAQASSTKRPKMQTGLVREMICPDGWPKHPRTLVYTLAACARYRHEDTCHAHTVNEAMTEMELEKEQSGTLLDWAFDSQTFEPITQTDVDKARGELLRLCDWIESRLHYLTHAASYRVPDCFNGDPDMMHLAKIGVGQRHLGKLSERDRKRWAGIHERAATKYGNNLKLWGMVGKVQHDPKPRTWTHPAVDTRIIRLWPLVMRHNWTYSDLLKVLVKIMPPPVNGGDFQYPLDSVESLKVHCRTICGLSKSGKGNSAAGLPEGREIAESLFGPTGK
jgi:hypothetical protein